MSSKRLNLGSKNVLAHFNDMRHPNFPGNYDLADFRTISAVILYALLYSSNVRDLCTYRWPGEEYLYCVIDYEDGIEGVDKVRLYNDHFTSFLKWYCNKEPEPKMSWKKFGF